MCTWSVSWSLVKHARSAYSSASATHASEPLRLRQNEGINFDFAKAPSRLLPQLYGRPRSVVNLTLSDLAFSRYIGSYDQKELTEMPAAPRLRHHYPFSSVACSTRCRTACVRSRRVCVSAHSPRHQDRGCAEGEVNLHVLRSSVRRPDACVLPASH
jgi:hypothetical protein